MSGAYSVLSLVPFFSGRAWAEPSASLEARRPNIIFVLTDDQGYGDLSCHGNPILKTPNLDRLHDEGVRFTDFHVSPTCSPTRSALMTGRHEFKNGVTHTILERERLTLKATTIAQVLKSAGYTTGIFGKWHLGDEPDHWPDKRGFDEMFIHGCGGIGQSYPGSCGDAPGNTYFNPAILHNGKFEKTKGYCTDVFFGQAPALDRIGEGQEAVLLLHPHERPACAAAGPARGRETLRRPGEEPERGEVLRHDRQHRRQRRPAPGQAQGMGHRARHAGHLHERQRRHGRRERLQRRHARREGHALAGRHAGVVVLALAGHAEARPTWTAWPPTSTSSPPWPRSPGRS